MRSRPVYLYLTSFFPSARSWRGGFCYDTVNALRRNGRYDVLVMRNNQSERDNYTIDGIDVACFVRRGLGSSRYFSTALTRWNNRLFFKKLEECGVRVEDVAVCHVQDIPTYGQYAVALKRANPLCVTLATHHFTAGGYPLAYGRLRYCPILSELNYFRHRYYCESFDAHIFVSEASRDSFGRAKYGDSVFKQHDALDVLPFNGLYRRVRLKDTYVWYNGVDRALFYPRPISHSGYVIGCVANFNPAKSQEDLIVAFSRIVSVIPDARLRFVGSGLTLSKCKVLAQRLGVADRVSFEPEMQHKDLPLFYNELDLFVLPSINEGFCCTYLEADACGIPIVACQGISIQEIMSHADRERFLVKPRDADDLVAKIVAIYHSRGKPQFIRDMDIVVLTRNYLVWLERKSWEIIQNVKKG